MMKNNNIKPATGVQTAISAAQKAIRSSRANQGGFILASAMMLITGLMLISVVSVKENLWHSDETGRMYQSAQTFYVAEAGAEWGQRWVYDLIDEVIYPTQTDLNAVTEPDINDYSYPELSVTKNSAYEGLVQRGAFSGMDARIRPYVIRSHAANHNELVEKVVTLVLNQEAIFMGNFGIYFDADLEMFPEYPLDYNGRIHTNGNLYVGSDNVLNIAGEVTAGGSIYNTPKDSTRSYSGKARFQNRLNEWRDLSYDSTDPLWEDLSLEDWDGRVLDQTHGVGTLPYPLPTPGEAIQIIKRGLPGDDAGMRNMRFYYKAGLRIIDEVAVDSAGTTVNLAPGILFHSAIPFYDHREQRVLDLLNIDIAALINSGQYPDNGIIYISQPASDDAIRLINGQQLPPGGLAIATDNPLYIQGHYNIISKQPASILSDAFNVLSIEWDDANADRPVHQRLSRATSVNTCAVTGNVPTEQGNYGGGAENLIRLHEKWVGHELTYRGSLVCIWGSEIAIGDFDNASYIEAHRNWGFDPELLNRDFWPEENLAMNRVSRGGWNQY